MSCSVKSVLTQNLRKVVSVNGVVMRHDEISREAQNHPAPTPIAAWTAAARALAVRELLLQEARRIVIDAEPLTDGEGRTETAEEASIRALVEREVSTPSPRRGRLPALLPAQPEALPFRRSLRGRAHLDRGAPWRPCRIRCCAH